LPRTLSPLFLLLMSVLVGCGGSANPAMNQGTSLSVIPATASLRVGDVLQLHAVAYSIETNQGITPKGSWSSSDAEIASVNSDGLLLGTSEGNATVTFVSSGQSIDVAVAVTPRASSLTISPISASIKSGSSFQFAAAGVVDGKEQDLTSVAVWTLDNSLLGSASIDGGLLLTDTGAVTTQTLIHVTVSYGGLKASAPVFVNP
jgi:Bacterial Ig-like domain (group 2)